MIAAGVHPDSVSGSLPPHPVVQPEESCAPDLEVVIGPEVAPGIDVYPDVFFEAFQVSCPAPVAFGLDEKVETRIAEGLP